MKLELWLTKGFKGLVFIVFVYMALVYFGVLLLLPLDILFQLIRVLEWLGLPALLATGLGLAGLGYLGYLVSRMPQLYKLLLDIGMELINFAMHQIKRFDGLLAPAASENAG